MSIFYSELCLIGGDVEENVERLANHGAENIELMLDGEGWNDFHLRSGELARRLRGRGVGYSVHVPVWDANLTSECARLRAAVLQSYRDSIAFAAAVDARHVVLHTGTCADRHFSKALARERAGEAMRELLRFNEDYGRLLLVENIGGPARSLFTQDEFIRFLDGFPDEIGYVVDIGHAHINGWNFDTLFPALGKRLRALHIHDNDGSGDAHLPIGTGTIDWRKTLSAASAAADGLALVLEYNIGTDLELLAEGKAFLEAAVPQERDPA
jgi:sugar phosphate isomerase/epimerase